MNPLINRESVTVFIEGRPVTVRAGQDNYMRIRALAKNPTAQNITAIEALLSSPVQEVQKAAERTQTGVSIVNGQVYYNGAELPFDGLVNKLLALKQDPDLSVDPWCRFVERLMKNPSFKSIENLFEFLGRFDLPIDDEGFFYAYRGVMDDFWSKTGNLKTVVVTGKTNSVGQIFNGVGEKIRVERWCVEDDPSKGCSYGLHLGSFSYACAWAEKVVLVRCDPADVVSVPSSSATDKCRVCAYEVVREVAKGVEVQTPYTNREQAVSSGLSSNTRPATQGELLEAIEAYESDFDDIDDMDIQDLEQYLSNNIVISDECFDAAVDAYRKGERWDDDEVEPEEDEPEEVNFPMTCKIGDQSFSPEVVKQYRDNYVLRFNEEPTLGKFQSRFKVGKQSEWKIALDFWSIPYCS